MESFGEPPIFEHVQSDISQAKNDPEHSRKQSVSKPPSPTVSSLDTQKLGQDPSSGKDDKPDSQNAATETAPYPQLSHMPSESEDGTKDLAVEGEEPETAKSFDRSATSSVFGRNRGASYEKVGEEGVSRMHQFTLYETSRWFYIVGGDLLDTKFRILKVDRTSESGELTLVEDDIVYTKTEMNQLLNAIGDGNKSSGGLKLKSSTWGLLGFIRFTGVFYMLFITKRKQVAMVGGHYIYRIDGTELVPLNTPNSSKKTEKNPEEARFIGILNNLDLTRSFYFSYSYDITRTLQRNILRERKSLEEGLAQPAHDFNDMFIWNHHLLQPAQSALKNVFDWCLPIVHGYVDQAALSIYWGRSVYVTIIARRSRFFAGARFLKRGANDLGYVANDVETEQIVAEMLTTSFHAPGPTLYASPNYTSYVQHRGSIPLYWTQDSSGVTPKPDINLNLIDPFYGAAALHFDDLFQRYGAPVYVLNLIKARERTERESKLLREFTDAIRYLNQFLPNDRKILYKAWDMSRASKSRDQDVIGTLESIAEDIIPKTGFFQNGNDKESGLKLQNGVVRTNCIDCLDRTNAAQFVIGKRALGHQLEALGVTDNTSIDYDTDAINLFTHMWHDHGDTIAIQYGGSHLVNTMATYRKINQWTSHPRDMVESFKRYYNNSFMDAQRQEAYNLFLGNYVFAQGQPMLWDLSTDYYLHHSDPRAYLDRRKPDYINWYTPEHLHPVAPPPTTWSTELSAQPLTYFDDYWLEYYRPLAISSFQKMFSFKMQSNLRYIPIKSASEGRYDLSPFKVRSHTADQNDNTPDSRSKSSGTRHKGVKIADPADNATPASETALSVDTQIASSSTAPIHTRSRRYTGIIKEPSLQTPFQPTVPPIPPSALNTPAGPPSKAEQAVEAFTRLVTRSLNPTVADAEEYQRYVTHPLQIPLVVSSAVDYQKTNKDFLDYVNRVREAAIDGPPASSFNEAPGGAGAAGVNNGHTRSRSSAASIEQRARQNEQMYKGFLEVGDEGLTVLEEDGGKKRYKRYRQWLRGKSLFKQRPADAFEV
ncbi:MAG: hypothetical protein Q9227_002662 [Pyrenula ochraceoflavens]